MSAYLKVFTAGFAGLILVILMNLVVDPYGIYDLFSWKGVNTTRPVMQNHEKLVKAYLTTRMEPAMVAMGTSRAEFGIDPGHASWGTDGPRFNLALAGGNTFVTRRFLEHVLSSEKLKKVVLGLDFFAFNTIRPIASDYTDSVLAVLDDGTPNPGHLWNIIVTTTLSRSAIDDTLETLKANEGAAIQEINPETGMRLFSTGGKRIETRELQSNVKKTGSDQSALKSFNAMEELYLRHVYLAGAKREFAFENPETGSFSLQEFRRLVRLCRKHGIDCRFFISPPHARHMEVIRAIGLWPLFEQWKRELVLTIQEEGVEKLFPLWDFSGYNSITTKDVPRDSRMREYLDSTHYSPFVGDMVLTRVLGESDASLQSPPDFGIRLTAANIEETLAADRERQAAYHQRNPRDVRDIEALAEKYGFNPDFVVFSGEPRMSRARSYRNRPPPAADRPGARDSRQP